MRPPPLIRLFFLASGAALAVLTGCSDPHELDRLRQENEALLKEDGDLQGKMAVAASEEQRLRKIQKLAAEAVANEKATKEEIAAWQAESAANEQETKKLRTIAEKLHVLQKP